MRKHSDTRVRVAPPRIKPAGFRVPVSRNADPELLTVAHRAWRLAVLRRAGYQCEAIEDGVRCDKAAPDHRLFADHINERRDGGALFDPANGQCLCGHHHNLKTYAARVERLKQ